jgi:co-chaperonin GroES (HSP10)
MKTINPSAHEEEELDLSNLPPVLPKPVQYHILVAIPKMPDTTSGGIIKPDALVDKEQMASMFGMVLAMGPDAYVDQKRFPSGPACKLGDWVMFRAYSGTRFKLTIDETEYRVVPDDSVQATIEDPRFIRGM